MQKVRNSLKILSDTRSSAHHDSPKTIRENIEQLVNRLQEMCDPCKESFAIRSAVSILLIHALYDFTVLKFFGIFEYYLIRS